MSSRQSCADGPEVEQIGSATLSSASFVFIGAKLKLHPASNADAFKHCLLSLVSSCTG